MQAKFITIPALLVVAYFAYDLVTTESVKPTDQANSDTGYSSAVGSDIVSPKQPNKPMTTIEKIKDTSSTWKHRATIIKGVNAQGMSSKQIAELYALLDEMSHTKSPDEFVVINELMGKIVNYGLDADKITDTLRGLLNNVSLDPVVRDYAAQHLGTWITPQQLDRPAEKSAEKVSAGLNSLFASLTSESNQQTSIAGTSLMMLVYTKRAGRDLGDIEPRLHAWLDQQLLNPNKSISAINLKSDAINAIGMLGLSSELSKLRNIALDSTAHPSLRLTSISSIGSLGGNAEISLLQTIQQDSPQFSHAVQSAIKKLNTPK